MAAIEGISGAGMAYQGSTATSQVKAEVQPKVEAGELEITSNEIATDTMSMVSNETDPDGGSQEQQNNESLAKQHEKIKKAVDDINKKSMNSEAVFGIHEQTNRITIKIVDKQTKEVIKELPPEKTLDLIAKAWEMAGLMVDERR